MCLYFKPLPGVSTETMETCLDPLLNGRVILDAEFVYGMVEITMAVMFTAGILSFNDILWYSVSNYGYFVTRILRLQCICVVCAPVYKSKLSISKP